MASCDASSVSADASECAHAAYPAWASSEYVLPYAVGNAYGLVQGNCGGFSHLSGSALAYSYDFEMPIGTVVTAARSGVVDIVEEAYSDDDHVRGHENWVFVSHGDGTYGAYLHFTRGGVAVDVGDTVASGDTLGRSGNSGYSVLPHLHFDVRSDCSDDRCRPEPVTFRNTSPNPRGLVEGQAYRALPYAP